VSTSTICIIYNPTAGRGRAPRRLEQLRQALGEQAQFLATQCPRHAEALALQAAKAGCAIVAAAGGDGTVHEVANGILRAGRPDVALAVVPIGSANDYAYSLGLASPGPRQVDVGLVRAADGRQRYFVNGLGLGFNGAVTLEARGIRRLQGVLLYGMALLRALWTRYKFPRMLVALDGYIHDGPTLALSVAIGRREGNFVLAPEALVDDGLFDYVLAGVLSRWQLLRQLPAMITGRLPAKHPAVLRGRCRQVQVRSAEPLAVHLDGELFCRPEDEVRELEIQLVPAGLNVAQLDRARALRIIQQAD
jgi:diacylglycerol kinase family enzyme